VQNKDAIEQGLDELKRQYGDWSYDIPLPFDIWTRGNLQLPHTRLKRIVQIVNDLSKKPLSESRILDLGCLDGIFSIEFAHHGASTIGVEIREANIKKAIFCQEVLGLSNLEFRQDDVRNITLQSYGKFDAIICSGILYHLPSDDAINLIKTMFEMVTRVVVIDTHVALTPNEHFFYDGHEYWGSIYREHADDATPEMKAKNLWSSADNSTSFWFTRPSLINILGKVGFSSVYECFTPPIIGHLDRCTIIAIKDHISELTTSPTANSFQDNWPEYSLTYAPITTAEGNPSPLYRRILSKLKRTLLNG